MNQLAKPPPHANGTVWGFVRRILEDHGPFAIMLAAACAALYLTVIVPFQEQQRLLTESNRILLENTLKQTDRLSDSFEKMSLCGEKNSELLHTLAELGEQRNKQIVEQIADNRAILEALTTFSQGVKEQHKDASEKLDTIIRQTTPP